VLSLACLDLFPPGRWEGCIRQPPRGPLIGSTYLELLSLLTPNLWPIVAAAVLFASPAGAGDQDPPRLTPGETQVVVNNTRLWYRAAGQASGTPVVFLHGGPGQGSQTFAQFAGPWLEPHLRMVYLDQRGSGRSERPWDESYSLKLLIDDLEQLRLSWGVDRISLIGHSFGTIIALEYAAAYPERTEKVALLAAAPDLPWAMDVQCQRLEKLDPQTYARAAQARPAGSAARCDPFTAGRAFIDEAMFPDPTVGELVAAADAAGGLRNTGELGRVLFGQQGLGDYRFDRPERLNMPVLVLAGLSDFQTVVEPQRDLASRLPDAEIREYPGRGHFMFVEDPEQVANDLIAFLSP
jgi:proline iminopeptidase